VSAAGALEQVHGVEALAQALTLALSTQLGSDPVNAGFGFDLRALGDNPFGVRARREYVRLELVRTVAAERRVKEVRELYFDDDARFFERNPGVDRDAQRRAVRRSRRTTATIELETRSGDRLALDATVPDG
jgi:phage baseplate assembly protein W